MKTLKDWLKIDVNGQLAPRHVNLLIQKTTADDDDVYSSFCYSEVDAGHTCNKSSYHTYSYEGSSWCLCSSLADLLSVSCTVLASVYCVAYMVLL